MLTALLLDDQPKQLERGFKHLQKLFASWPVQPEIETRLIDAAKAVDLQIVEIRDKTVAGRPHMLFVDNKWGKDASAGQRFIAQVKRRLPETVCCLLSRESLTSNQFGIRTPNPDCLIDKGQLGGSEEYRTYITNELRSKITRLSRFEFAYATTYDSLTDRFRGANGKRPDKREFESVIEQALFDNNFGNERKTAAIEALTGGRSGALVLSCKMVGALHYGVRGVIKVAKPSDSIRERDNYAMYVKWVLPYTWKVEVLGTGMTENLGAVCYSFAFEGDTAPISCATLLNECNDSVVEAISASIFDKNRKTWYAEVKDVGRDASEYFQSDRFYSKPAQIYERDEELNKNTVEIFGSKLQEYGDVVEFCGVKTKRAGNLIFTEDWGNVEECICHGDLNANNVLVNRQRLSVAFIDFQHTGYHNIYRDFVSFESSIRIDWGEAVDIADAEELLQEEIQMCKDGSRRRYKSKYLDKIAIVRDAAFANFPIDGQEHDGGVSGERRYALYLIAAYVHYSWLVSRFWKDWQPAARARLILGAFSSLAALQELRDVG